MKPFPQVRKQISSVANADTSSERRRTSALRSQPLSIIGATFLLFGIVSTATCAVVPVANGYEVSYGITLHTLPTNGGDIVGTFIFEWNDSGDFNVDYPYRIAGRTATDISHVISFEPTAALLIGYALGIPGIGDEKDHIFTFVNPSFANDVLGLKWSEAFPGVTPAERIRHDDMVDLLSDAAAGDGIALDKLTTFVKGEAYDASFDPAGEFKALEWSISVPDIPEPGTCALLGIGGAGLLVLRRRN
jgi:PEP-CTERM motif